MPPAPRRGRGGRPAGEAPALALAAAVELIVERGYAGMSVDAVAAAAGVSKATLYRHWPTKESLAVAAVQAIPCVLPEPTADPRHDATALLGHVVHGWSGAYGAMMRRFLDSGADQPRLAAAWRASVIAPRRGRMREIVVRARDAGQLSADVDPDAAVDMMVGAIVYRALVAGEDAAALPDVLVAAVWAAWRPAGPG